MPVADAGTDAGSTGCIPGLQFITLAPDQGSVALPQGQSVPVAFTATGTDQDGNPFDITRRVTWLVSRSDGLPPGPIDPDGTYHPTPDEGGVVSVQASDGCVTGQTTLAVSIEVLIVQDPSIPPLFAGPSISAPGPHVPAFIYPNDQTRFPKNLWDLLIQWQSAQDTAFRLTFKGPFTRVTLYTDGAGAACAGLPGVGCWETDPNAWQFIGRENGGYPVLMQIEGHAPGDPNVYVAPTMSIEISRVDWPGAVLYWSTDAAGLVRSTWMGAEPFLTGVPASPLADGSQVKCAGCHTVSPSGAKLLEGLVTSADAGLSIVTPGQPASLGAVLNPVERQFGTFSPDERRVVANVGTRLHLFDVNGGADLGPLPVDQGGQPSWSPRGDRLIYVDVAGESPYGASLYAIDYLGSDQWAAAATLLAAPLRAGGTNTYPAVGPDDETVVFAAGLGGHDDLRTLLEVVDLDGGAPVELFNANRIVNNQVTSALHENALPTWGPPAEWMWVAFSSKRPYGALTPDAGATNHLWVTAIDPRKLRTGADPSSPAFYYPFQRFDQNNHRAFWLRDGVPPPPLDGGFPEQDAGTFPMPDGGGVCLPLGAPCDQVNPPPCCPGGLCDVADGGYACQ